MKQVKVMPRFKCDFCKKRSIKRVMELHEKRCFRNPNRFCDYCDNTGKVEVSENEMSYKEDCPYCGSFDKKQLEEIEKREKSLFQKPEVIVEEQEIPF